MFWNNSWNLSRRILDTPGAKRYTSNLKDISDIVSRKFGAITKKTSIKSLWLNVNSIPLTSSKNSKRFQTIKKNKSLKEIHFKNYSTRWEQPNYMRTYLQVSSVREATGNQISLKRVVKMKINLISMPSMPLFSITNLTPIYTCSHIKKDKKILTQISCRFLSTIEEVRL